MKKSPAQTVVHALIGRPVPLQDLPAALDAIKKSPGVSDQDRAVIESLRSRAQELHDDAGNGRVKKT